MKLLSELLDLCKELGIKTVAVYSIADKESMHVKWLMKVYVLEELSHLKVI